MSPERRAVLVVMSVILVAGCGIPSEKQSVGATTPTTKKSTVTTGPPPTTTMPILAPGTAASFTVRPTVVAIGQTLTYSGRGCPPNDQVQALTPGGGLATKISPAADGSWSATLTVGDGADTGPVRITAGAVLPQGRYEQYTPVTIEVTTTRHLEVQPSTFVHPGDTLTVTAVGSCSISPPGFAMYAALLETNGTFVPGQPDQAFNLDPAGVWSGPFVVPASTPPGPYLLQAYCSDRGYRRAFNPLPITVLAADVAIPQPPSPAGGSEIPITR